MEDKRGIKWSRCSLYKGKSISQRCQDPSTGAIWVSTATGNSVRGLLTTPSLTVFEQGSPSGNILVIDLSSSSDEEDFVADTSRDEDFPKRLFGDLNHDVPRPPSDGKVIILSDSDKEEEVHEETIDAMFSATEKSLTPAASATNSD
jgi:hypothetical protein